MKKIVLIVCSLCLLSSVYADNSPYLSHVWEFLPAPGQFVHELPKYVAGDDAEAMRQKAENQIANNAQGMISLGGWGGYVVFSFDHPVVNVAEEKDFIVEGNAFYQDATQGAAGGGSCEPGIVMVSRDDNGNGLPDDAWYELAGSEYTNLQTKHGYSVTYTRPSEDHEATPDPNQKYRTDTTFVHWVDNRGDEGYIEQNSFHKHAYYPEWIEEDELTFSGARLPDNYRVVKNQFVLFPYDYGYADNHPDTARLAQLDIEWAVNEDGTPVSFISSKYIRPFISSAG